MNNNNLQMVNKIKQLSYGYLDLCQKKILGLLKDNRLNICRAFNQNVQYPHAIDTSMTIHMQGETKFPK